MELPVAEQDSVLASKLEYEELMPKGGKLAAEACFRCDEVSLAKCPQEAVGFQPYSQR